jgi:hypothetical protein
VTVPERTQTQVENDTLGFTKEEYDGDDEDEGKGVGRNDIQDRPSRPGRPRTTLGQRWCQQYIPVLQLNAYILAHSCVLVLLLTLSLSHDRRTKLLRPKPLKKANYLLKSELRYFQFLRHQIIRMNVRQFQLFPKYKMTTKHFGLDQRILKTLRNTELVADAHSGKRTVRPRRRRPRRMSTAFDTSHPNVPHTIEEL